MNRQNTGSREEGFGNVLGIMKLAGKGIATGTPEAFLISMAKMMTPSSLNMIFDALKECYESKQQNITRAKIKGHEDGGQTC